MNGCDTIFEAQKDVTKCVNVYECEFLSVSGGR